MSRIHHISQRRAPLRTMYVKGVIQDPRRKRWREFVVMRPLTPKKLSTMQSPLGAQVGQASGRAAGPDSRRPGSERGTVMNRSWRRLPGYERASNVVGSSTTDYHNRVIAGLTPARGFAVLIKERARGHGNGPFRVTPSVSRVDADGVWMPGKDSLRPPRLVRPIPRLGGLQEGRSTFTRSLESSQQNVSTHVANLARRALFGVTRTGIKQFFIRKESKERQCGERSCCCWQL
jgi:hypothetical protein